jgi:hypothetical protein
MSRSACGFCHGLGRARDDLGDAHPGNPATEDLAINGITVSQHPSWGSVVRKGFNDLLGRPCRRGMFRDREVNDPATMLGEHHEDEQHAAGEREHREEIHGDQGRHVIRQEGPPGLGRRTRSLPQESGDRPLRDVDAQFAQIAMDPRRSPQRIRGAHLGDERATSRSRTGTAWTSLL